MAAVTRLSSICSLLGPMLLSLHCVNYFFRSLVIYIEPMVMIWLKFGLTLVVFHHLIPIENEIDVRQSYVIVGLAFFSVLLNQKGL